MNNNRAWIDEFYSHGVLVKITPEQEQILDKNVRGSLFQYRRGDVQDLKNIKNGVIWASAVERFNDPYDCDFNKQLMKEWCNKILYMASSDEIRNGIESLEEQVTLLRDTTAISCFSEKSDSILMWSHYANKHQGICACYDIFDLINLKKVILPVWYRSEKINPFLYGKNGRFMINKRVKEIFIQKSPEWSYEEEWRLIDFVGGNQVCDLKKNGGKMIEGIYPKRIILGARVKESIKKEILEIGRVKRIKITQMKLNDESFELQEI